MHRMQEHAKDPDAFEPAKQSTGSRTSQDEVPPERPFSESMPPRGRFGYGTPVQKDFGKHGVFDGIVVAYLADEVSSMLGMRYGKFSTKVLQGCTSLSLLSFPSAPLGY